MNVLVGYLHANHLSASFHKSLLGLITHDQQNLGRIANYGAVRTPGYGIPDSRNHMAEKTLELGLEWLFFIDADMGFRPDTLDELLEVADPKKRPVVGGLCFAYKDVGIDLEYQSVRNTPIPTIYDFVDGNYHARLHYPANAVIPVAATGAACLLIHRSALEAVHALDGSNWFTRIAGPDGDLMGEDISFFDRLRRCEIPAWVHTGVRTTHHKEIHLSETDFWASFDAPPATEPVTVIVPTVAERIHNIPRLATTLRASTGLAELVLVVDDEDHAAAAKEWGRTVIQPGSFPVKVNAGYRHTDTPWIKVVGDDVRFRAGWLDHAQLVARLYGASVVGSNDLANPRVMAGAHATHWMIARDYIEEVGASWDGPGIVCHEGYHHWFCDDEIVTAARLRGVFQAALGSIVEHLHPITGRVETDEVYRRNDAHAEADRELFLARWKANT